MKRKAKKFGFWLGFPSSLHSEEDSNISLEHTPDPAPPVYEGNPFILDCFPYLGCVSLSTKGKFVQSHETKSVLNLTTTLVNSAMKKKPGGLGYIGGLYYPIYVGIMIYNKQLQGSLLEWKVRMAQLLVDSLFHVQHHGANIASPTCAALWWVTVYFTYSSLRDVDS